jgi:glycine cleavage system aminomethyltransferase T
VSAGTKFGLRRTDKPGSLGSQESPVRVASRSLGEESQGALPHGAAAPLVFTSTEEEHRATREAVGVFDVYYQVAVEVAGRDAAAFVQHVVVADAAGLAVRRAVYTSLCNDEGGMIDDLTCFRLAPERYWLLPTPSRVAAVLGALSATRGNFGVTVTNLGYKNAYLSIQGPNSRRLLSALTDADLSAATLPYYSFTEATVADVPGTLLSRTGYSGELGFELFYPVEYAEHMWDRVFSAGTRSAFAPVAWARCEHCDWKRSTCCSGSTPTTRQRRSKPAWDGQSSSISPTSSAKPRSTGSGQRASIGASC